MMPASIYFVIIILPLLNIFSYAIYIPTFNGSLESRLPEHGMLVFYTRGGPRNNMHLGTLPLLTTISAFRILSMYIC